jgi:hypothetical protein
MRKRLSQLILFVAALAGAPSLAAAQAPAGVETQVTRERGLLTPYGEYFLLGGGVTNYFDNALKDRVDTGGTWDLRLGLGSRSFIGGEIAYVGSAREANDLGRNLVTNGAEGVLRLQYPYDTGRVVVTPFTFGGAGWTHFEVNGPRGGARLQDTDDVFVVPVGGGLTLAYDHVLLDTRFTYRQTFDENLIQAADGTAAGLNNGSPQGLMGPRCC